MSFSLTSLRDTLVSLNLMQLVDTPTHRKGYSLDLVFPNVCDKISDLLIDSSVCSLMSDHYLISFCLYSRSHIFSEPLSIPYSNVPKLIWITFILSLIPARRCSFRVSMLILPAWLQLKSDTLSDCDYAVPTILFLLIISLFGLVL